MKMTVFRSHDAAIALRQIGKTGITVTLAEAFSGNAPAMHTFDLLQVLDPDALAKVVTQDQPLTTQFEAVTNRTVGLGVHLVQVAL
jgi:formate-dependent phosphoribosylglycinamide formyltransferase (GAR transformylase)